MRLAEDLGLIREFVEVDQDDLLLRIRDRVELLVCRHYEHVGLAHALSVRHAVRQIDTEFAVLHLQREADGRSRRLLRAEPTLGAHRDLAFEAIENGQRARRAVRRGSSTSEPCSGRACGTGSVILVASHGREEEEEQRMTGSELHASTLPDNPRVLQSAAPCSEASWLR